MEETLPLFLPLVGRSISRCQRPPLATFYGYLACVPGIKLDVYLIQHGESKSKEEDPARPLTERGRKSVENVGADLARVGVSFDRVFHSGKLRAQQTAEILADSLGIGDKVEAHSGLDPMDPVKPIMDWFSELAERALKSVAIVGHLPFLDKLASILVTGSESAGVIAFQYAGVVRLVPKAEGQGYRVRWVLTSELITQ
jgi:phosphohistidine phosphatase